LCGLGKSRTTPYRRDNLISSDSNRPSVSLARQINALPRALIAFAVLWIAGTQGANAGGCSSWSLLTTSCPTRGAPWKLFVQPSQPIEDVALVVQDARRAAEGPMSEFLAASKTQEDGPLRIMAQRVARVMSVNGVPTRYAGHAGTRSELAALAGEDGHAYVLMLLPDGEVERRGIVHYLAILYGPRATDIPLLQSEMRLGRGAGAPAQDIAATKLALAFSEAGLSRLPADGVAPISLLDSFGSGL
jgi:hypothetical protein